MSIELSVIKKWRIILGQNWCHTHTQNGRRRHGVKAAEKTDQQQKKIQNGKTTLLVPGRRERESFLIIIIQNIRLVWESVRGYFVRVDLTRTHIHTHIHTLNSPDFWRSSPFSLFSFSFCLFFVSRFLLLLFNSALLCVTVPFYSALYKKAFPACQIHKWSSRVWEITGNKLTTTPSGWPSK